jgi:predicted cupin superfamily sugar epimerase
VIAGDRPQVVVGAHEWQSAVPLPGSEGYTLVSCVVTPGFKFSGFTLAPPDWRPGA